MATAEFPPQLEPESPQISDELEQELVRVFKLLSSAPRCKILLHLLREGELNVTDLCRRIEQTQPAVSHHLALLREHKVIRLRRDGKHSYYSVSSAPIQEVLERLLQAIMGPRGCELQMGEFSIIRPSLAK